MARERFKESHSVDPLEIREPFSVDEAAGELMDFLFNPDNGLPFGVSQFTFDQLKEKYFAQATEGAVKTLPPSVFPYALKHLCDSRLLGFDEQTNTYYNKESA